MSTNQFLAITSLILLGVCITCAVIVVWKKPKIRVMTFLSMLALGSMMIVTAISIYLRMHA